MPKAKQALQHCGVEDFVGRVLTPSAAATPEGGEGPPATMLVLFDRGVPEDRRLAAVVAAAVAEHGDRLQAFAVTAADALARLEQWQEGRRAVDSFDFRRWPVVGVFRRGRLVTTFHPRHVYFIDRLQEREEREQLEIFLAKMVYYDPSRVKEQKNLELEAEA